MTQQLGLMVTHRIEGFYCPQLLTTEQITAVYHPSKSTGVFFPLLTGLGEKKVNLLGK